MTSNLEAAFATYWRMLGGPDLEAEYRFDEGRRWRFDFAHLGARVAVELEGGTWNGGRHNRPQGFSADCEKYNAAALAGWLVFRFTGDMLTDDPAGSLEPVIGLIEARRMQAMYVAGMEYMLAGSEADHG